MSKFEVRLEQEKLEGITVSIIEFFGIIDVSFEKELINLVNQSLEEGAKCFILFFSNLKINNGEDLAELIHVREKRVPKGIPIKLVDFPELATKLFEDAGWLVDFEMYSSADQALKSISPQHDKCQHPFPKLQRIASTCGYIDADFIYCQRCDTYLYGNFASHSDNCSYPSVVFDKQWMQGKQGFHWGTEGGSLQQDKYEKKLKFY